MKEDFGMWYVVDEFGFAMNEYFQTKEEAEESRIIWENTAVAKQWNLKYEIKFREE